MKIAEHQISSIPPERIMGKIYWIREQRVMLDSDLAELYEVETRVLNQSVQRNIERFPKDFMFQLTAHEAEILISQFVTSSWGGKRKLPYVFTEQGVAMLSSVLRSPRAVQINIHIIRVFTQLREMLLTHKDLRDKIDKMERKYDKQFRAVFDVIKEMMDKSHQHPTPEPYKPIKIVGFEDRSNEKKTRGKKKVV